MKAGGERGQGEGGKVGRWKSNFSPRGQRTLQIRLRSRSVATEWHTEPVPWNPSDSTSP